MPITGTANMKQTRYQVWAQRCGDHDPHSLLLGMWTGKATSGGHPRGLLKPTQPFYPHTSVQQKRGGKFTMKVYRMFTAALLVITANCK